MYKPVPPPPPPPQQRTPSLAPDETHFDVNEYVKVRDLGKGSHGVCCIVRHIPSGRNSVMKEVDLTGMDEKEQLATVNESSVLCNLVHPNIIRYEGSTMTEGKQQPQQRRKSAPKDSKLCILMEYASGGDLYSRITRQRGRGPINEIQVVDWFIQLLLAIRQMHKQRVLHRDIKSHNVFLTGDGVIKIGDFGISRVLDYTLQNAYSFVGTPYYLSPELLQRKPYNYASDMWALGVLLCELMVQNPPFTGHDMESLKKNIILGRYQQPSSATYSKDLRSIVSLLLQQNPKARPCANRLLHHPYIRTRLDMWFEGGAALRIPRPPEWYLAELKQNGLLDDLLTPSLGVGQGLGPAPTPAAPSDVVSAANSGAPASRFPVLAAAARQPQPPPPPPVRRDGGGAPVGGRNVGGGGRVPGGILKPDKVSNVAALPPIAAQHNDGDRRRGRRHYVR
eukprot:PhM_4_TR17335/c0_g1_i1/m.7757/K08857/NEK1_4_5; NIMA (never in mitosis gene a)-related kinase 1/4/5